MLSMGKKQLQSLFIGPRSQIYDDLLKLLRNLDLDLQVKQTKLEGINIASSLKRCRGACLIFISDNTNVPLEKLSDLVWRYSPDAIIVIVTNKTITTSLKKPFNNTQISKLFIEKNSEETDLYLQYLIQYAQLKLEFRKCKTLLGTSEKRCRWLVDSSKEAVAYVSRQMHLYANTAYLGLFGVDSIEKIQSIPIQELVGDDEFGLYEDYIKQQLRNHHIDRSLVLSMKKDNGAIFRVNIHAIPSVYNRKKCIQLWIKPLNRELQESHDDQVKSDVLIDQTKSVDALKKASNPFDVLYKPTNDEPRKRLSRVSSSSILREIIKRKEATISVQKISSMKNKSKLVKNGIDHYLVSLKVAIAQRKGIEDLLFQSVDATSKESQNIFWDKVKLVRLIQALKKKTINSNLIVKLSEGAVKDKEFILWLIPNIKRLGKNASNLIFLIPCQPDSQERRLTFRLIKQLRLSGSKIALDEFRVSREHLAALKYIRPDYVRLSLPWVRQIEGTEKHEISLGGLVRKLESRNIKVIAPCGFSRDMKKLFALSGASFCQEKTHRSV